MPHHVINEFWTTNLDVNLFCECKHFVKWKCDTSLDFSSLMQMLPTKMKMFIWCTCLLTNMQMQISMMQISHYRDANTISLRYKFPYRNVNAKFIHDDANAPLRRCRCKSLFFDIKISLASMAWRKCFFSWCKCNLTKNSFYSPNRGFLGAWNQNAFKNQFFFLRLFFFILERLECPVHHSCPKNMFYFDLRLPQKLVITVTNLRMGYQFEIRWSGLRRFISTVW